jgi:hypothetical protein
MISRMQQRNAIHFNIIRSTSRCVLQWILRRRTSISLTPASDRMLVVWYYRIMLLALGVKILGGLAGPLGCGGILDMNKIQNSNEFQYLLHSVG